MPPKQQPRGGPSSGGRPKGGGDGGRHSNGGNSVGRSGPNSASAKVSTPPKASSATSAAAPKAPVPKPVTEVRNYDPNEMRGNSPNSASAATELAIKQELDSLDEHLYTIGKVRLAVAKDGACMFRSMAQAVFENQSLHMRVREACVSYLMDNEDHYKYFIDLKCDMANDKAVHAEWMTYTQSLMAPTAWGGQLELQSLSHCYSRNFIIYQAVPCKPSSDTLAQSSRSSDLDSHQISSQTATPPSTPSDATPPSSSQKPSTLPKKKTHDVILTHIDNGFAEEVSLAYSHGNHYDVIVDLPTIDRLVYYQRLVHHAIDTFFQRPQDRTDYWLQDLSFERDPDTWLTPKERLAAYDNRQWKIWQTHLQKEKREDEQIARSLIASEAASAPDLSGPWEVVGSSRKKKGGAGNNDALAKQQSARMEELSKASSKAQEQYDRDVQLAKSLEEGIYNDGERDVKRRQMEEDERIAMALSDEQLALQLSRELNAATVSVPGSTPSSGSKALKGVKPQNISTPSPRSSTSASTPSHATSTAHDDDDGFIPSSKKARNQQAKSKAAESTQAISPASSTPKPSPKKTAEDPQAKQAKGTASNTSTTTTAPQSSTWATLAAKPSSSTPATTPSSQSAAPKETVTEPKESSTETAPAPAPTSTPKSEPIAAPSTIAPSTTTPSTTAPSTAVPLSQQSAAQSQPTSVPTPPSSASQITSSPSASTNTNDPSKSQNTRGGTRGGRTGGARGGHAKQAAPVYVKVAKEATTAQSTLETTPAVENLTPVAAASESSSAKSPSTTSESSSASHAPSIAPIPSAYSSIAPIPSAYSSTESPPPSLAIDSHVLPMGTPGQSASTAAENGSQFSSPPFGSSPFHSAGTFPQGYQPASLPQGYQPASPPQGYQPASPPQAYPPSYHQPPYMTMPMSPEMAHPQMQGFTPYYNPQTAWAYHQQQQHHQHQQRMLAQQQTWAWHMAQYQQPQQQIQEEVPHQTNLDMPLNAGRNRHPHM